jgi:hypothetical protein
VRRLCGFRRLALEPGATAELAIDVALRDLARFDADARRWVVDAGAWRLWAGFSAREGDLRPAEIELPAFAWSVSDRTL